MSSPGFQRARSADAKQQRERAILDAARTLGEARGIRRVTLTDIADAVGMHKSALLRYFETREQIFLLLTAEGWREWGPVLRAEIDALTPEPTTDSRAPSGAADAALVSAEAAGYDAAGAAVSGSRAATTGAGAGTSPVTAEAAKPAEPAGTASTVAGVAHAFASTLVARPMFCDLLAQAPLNLERNVSLDSVRDFKLVTLDEVTSIRRSLRRVLPHLTEQNAVDLIAAATALSGAYFQMATPGPQIEHLYRTDPRLTHAVVDVGPRVERTLAALLHGFTD